MKNMLKLTAWCTLAFVGIALAAVLAIVILINPNDYREDIQTLVFEDTGMELNIEGELGWQFWPWLGFSIGQSSLKTQADHDEIVSFAHAGIKVDLIALFSQNLNIDGIYLNKANITLIQYKDGTANWELAQTEQAVSEAPSASQPSADTPSEPDSSEPTSHEISIEVVSITGSQLTYIDEINNETFKVKDFEFFISDFEFDSYHPIETSFTAQYLKGNQSELDFDLDLSTHLRVEQSIRTIEAKSFKLSLNHRTLPGLTTPLKLDMQSTFALNLDAQTLTLNSFLLNTSEIDVDAWTVSPTDVSLSGTVDYGQPQLNITNFKAHSHLSNRAAGLKATPVGLSINSIQYDEANASGNLSKLEMLFDQALITAGIHYNNAKADHAFTAAVQSNDINLKTLLNKLGVNIKVPHREALRKFSFNAKLQGNSDALQVNNLNVYLDDSHLTGNISETFEPISTRFTLNLDRINLDHYIAQTEEKKATSTPTPAPTQQPAQRNGAAGQPAQGESIFPIELIKSLDIVGTFDAQAITFRTHPMKQFHTDIQIQDGVAYIKKLDTQLYDGEIKTSTQLNVNPALPTLTFELDVQALPLAPILEKEAELTRLTGDLYANGVYQTKGNDVETLKNSLNGDGKFELNNGAVLGINADELVCNAYTALKKINADEPDWSENTQFKKLATIVKARNGVISTAPLTIQTAGLSIDGKGNIKLSDMNLDYQTDIKVVGQTESQACQANHFIKDLPVIVTCKGNLEQGMASLCKPDISKMSKLYLKQAKEKAKEKLNAEKARAEAKLKAEKEKLEAEARAKAKAKEAELKRKAEAEKKAAEEKAKAKLKAEEERAKAKAKEKADELLEDYFDF